MKLCAQCRSYDESITYWITRDAGKINLMRDNVCDARFKVAGVVVGWFDGGNKSKEEGKHIGDRRTTGETKMPLI